MMTMSPLVGVEGELHVRAAGLDARPGGCRRRPRRACAWYSTSVSVWAGATVIESPVCTPMGSRFSIEQTTTQLSARSRMTSSSYSFQPGDRPLDEDLADGAGGEARAAARRANSLGRGGDAGALAAEDEGRADDHRQADLARRRPGPRPGCGRCPRRAPRGRSPAWPALNRSRSSAVAMASALAPISSACRARRARLALDQLHGQVERGLAAEGGQHGVGLLPLDDLRQDVGVERLDVGGVGEVGVGHDRGRVRVGQDHPVALGPRAPCRPGCPSSRTRRPGR